MILDILQNMDGGNAMQRAPVIPTGYEDPVAGMNFLEKLGLGLGGIDAVNSYRRQGLQMQDLQRKAQQDEALRGLAQRMQTGEITRDQALTDYAGITGDYSGIFGVGARAPAALQIYDRVKDMSPEERDLFFRTQRGQKTINLGDRQVVLDPQGGVRETYENQLKPGERPQTRYEQTAATEQAKIDVDRGSNIGKLEDQANLMLKTIDDILADETGLEASTGGFLGLQGRAASVTGGMNADQRRFQPKIDQLKGQTFLNAYERLKGGGVITEVEGAKAESALARLNQAQDPEDFRKALADLREVVNTGLARAKSETFEDDAARATRINWDKVNVNGGGDTGNTGGRRTIKFGDLQ